MALGKAVISSDISGNRDYVSDGETVVLYKPGDFNDLSFKIEYLLNNPEEIKRIGENAKKVVKEKFQFQRMVNEVYEIVKSVVK